MLKRDYRRLERVLHKMQSEEYVYQSMRSDIEYVNTFGKFRKRKGEVRILGGRYKYLNFKGGPAASSRTGNREIPFS